MVNVPFLTLGPPQTLKSNNYINKDTDIQIQFLDDTELVCMLGDTGFFRLQGIKVL